MVLNADRNPIQQAFLLLFLDVLKLLLASMNEIRHTIHLLCHFQSLDAEKSHQRDQIEGKTCKWIPFLIGVQKISIVKYSSFTLIPLWAHFFLCRPPQFGLSYLNYYKVSNKLWSFLDLTFLASINGRDFLLLYLIVQFFCQKTGGVVSFFPIQALHSYWR